MKLLYYLKFLKNQPFYKIIYRALKKLISSIHARLKSVKATFFSTFISDKEFLESLNLTFKDIESFSQYLRKRKNPKFFLDFLDDTKSIEIIKDLFPESIGNVLSDADRICQHIFDLLGSGPVFLGEKIDWHRDFKVNWKWNLQYYSLIKTFNLDNYQDIKVPWELSRCQHFVTLGKAYLYSKDEKYAIEFVNQISHWIQSNPPKFGVNWVCTMDVAIRIVNWIWGFYFFKDSPSLSEDFLLKFFKSILDHGRHIMNNLENKISIPGNHYLSNLVGLVYLGILFPEFKESKEWRSYGINGLIQEMEKQTYPDGTYFEGSISYHRLATEIFLSSTLLILLDEFKTPLPSDIRISNILTETYLKRLEKMLDFVLYYTKPNGNVPHLGDADDGRLHILSNYGKRDEFDHRYLLCLGSVLFNRPDFKQNAGKIHEEAFWLIGNEGLSSFNSLSMKSEPLKSMAFPDGGYYIMRHEDLYMIVDCITEDSKSPSGHKHNSRLSFEVFAFGKDFVVDPGTYIYIADSKWRNIFRSTEYHNTIQIDQYEQNEIDPLKLFWLGNQAKVRINKWESNDIYDFLDAEHGGYKRLPEPLTRRRQIFFSKSQKYWIIRDIIVPTKSKKLFRQTHSFNFILHFGQIEIIDNDLFSLSITAHDSNSNYLTFIPIKTNNLEKPRIENGWVSNKYGVKFQAPIVKYQKISTKPVEFLFLIYPHKNHKVIDTDEVSKMIPNFMKDENFEFF